MGVSRLLALVAAFMLASVVLVACEPTLRQASGVVMEVDSPSLGQVDAFELRTTEGESLLFDTSELRFRPEFPAAHLIEHRLVGDVITVTYKQEGDRLMVTQLDDPAH